MNNILYNNNKYKLSYDNDKMFILINDNKYELSSHPYGLCTYIKVFDESIILDGFNLYVIAKRIEENDETFSPLDFCKLIEYEILKYKVKTKTIDYKS